MCSLENLSHHYEQKVNDTLRQTSISKADISDVLPGEGQCTVLSDGMGGKLFIRVFELEGGPLLDIERHELSEGMSVVFTRIYDFDRQTEVWTQVHELESMLISQEKIIE